MSNDVIIDVNNLSKVYRIGLKEELPDNIASYMLQFLKAPFENFKKYRSLYKFKELAGKEGKTDDASLDLIWALRNVSFTVSTGEVVGIIGKNGAGKSTLLKILSRITVPTYGTAVINGRVSSLLEVGTGFHPELTGRENVFLNGTILGMTRREVSQKFDEIVEFSGIEKFIDTPVKRYSSGMRVRLAFSVAAHLEPEILIIDEVLAVGDERFQQKCIKKMEDVGKLGRTVLFVSHSMSAINRLCPRAMLIDNGRVELDGPAAKTVAAYLDSGHGTTAHREWRSSDEAPGNDVVRLWGLRVVKNGGGAADTVDIKEPIHLEIEYEVFESGHLITSHFHLDNAQGVRAFSIHDTDPEWLGKPRPVGRYISRATIPGNFLSDGMLYVSAVVLNLDPIETYCWVEEGIAFQVVDNLDRNTARGNWVKDMGGIVRPLLKWETEYTAA